MTNAPKTLEEARAYQYGRSFAPQRYRETDCAWEVWENDRAGTRHQCYRKKGHGPTGLYCKVHGQKLDPNFRPPPLVSTLKWEVQLAAGDRDAAAWAFARRYADKTTITGRNYLRAARRFQKAQRALEERLSKRKKD